MQKIILILLLAISPFLFSCNDSDTSTFQQLESDNTDNNEDTTQDSPADSYTSETVSTKSVNMQTHVDELTYLDEHTEDYVIPQQAHLNAFKSVLNKMLENEMAQAKSEAEAIGFNLYQIKDSETKKTGIYCLEEEEASGKGFYCINLGADFSHHISAPHPLYDTYTNTQATEVFLGLNAKYLSIATAHRCTNNGQSPCSGTTKVCTYPNSEPFKESDMAHTVDNYFYVFSTYLHDKHPDMLTIQLHGCGDTYCPSKQNEDDIVARISAGTTLALNDQQLVNQFNDALNAKLEGLSLGISKSCSKDEESDKQLCATTNPVGRYINGETGSPCTQSATQFIESRFLHIEQNKNLRKDDGAGDLVTTQMLIDTLAEVID